MAKGNKRNQYEDFELCNKKEVGKSSSSKKITKKHQESNQKSSPAIKPHQTNSGLARQLSSTETRSVMRNNLAKT